MNMNVEMKNAVSVFRNQMFGEIRILQESGKCLFCGADVAKALGYKNNRKALTEHCRCVTKRYAPHPQSPDKRIEMAFIPEGDVYRLIVHSKLPNAVKFERWVFEEVLPTIRKYGGYLGESLMEQIQQDPDVLFRFAEALLKERKDNNALRKELLALKPKAEFYDAFVNPGDCTNIRATAKELNVPERLFCIFSTRESQIRRCKRRLLRIIPLPHLGCCEPHPRTSDPNACAPGDTLDAASSAYPPSAEDVPPGG